MKVLYRIDFQHFITDAIDYFTFDEIMHCNYVVVSAEIANLNKCKNITKRIQLYPTTEIILCYEETKNKRVMEEMYLELLTIKTPGDEWIGDIIYTTLINPVLHHHDIVIVCDQSENVYIDVLCKHLKKEYSLEVIDLNKLFSEGNIGSVYIDRDKIRDKAVDIRRSATKKLQENIATTRDGRLSLLKDMSTKDKIAKLKDLGIEVRNKDKDNLDALLIDAWVEDDGGG